LKGGDPFIFGRGSEECEWLREHGISFEVVPGVSAVSAVPAYAGIPITARGVSPSFLAVTGHERACKGSPDVDWASIAQVNTTLVVFMGILSLRGICHELMKHGRDPETPIAVIRWGTVREKQVSLTGTLSDMADRVEQESIRPPGLIVIGEVVRHRERLQWFEAHMGCGKAADAFPNG
ncbi:HemD protein, partial [bacterium]|nr:HemD protein [bacterium]